MFWRKEMEGFSSLSTNLVFFLASTCNLDLVLYLALTCKTLHNALLGSQWSRMKLFESWDIEELCRGEIWHVVIDRISSPRTIPGSFILPRMLRYKQIAPVIMERFADKFCSFNSACIRAIVADDVGAFYALEAYPALQTAIQAWPRYHEFGVLDLLPIMIRYNARRIFLLSANGCDKSKLKEITIDKRTLADYSAGYGRCWMIDVLGVSAFEKTDEFVSDLEFATRLFSANIGSTRCWWPLRNDESIVAQWTSEQVFGMILYCVDMRDFKTANCLANSYPLAMKKFGGFKRHRDDLIKMYDAGLSAFVCIFLAYWPTQHHWINAYDLTDMQIMTICESFHDLRVEANVRLKDPVAKKTNFMLALSQMKRPTLDVLNIMMVGNYTCDAEVLASLQHVPGAVTVADFEECLLRFASTTYNEAVDRLTQSSSLRRALIVALLKNGATISAEGVERIRGHSSREKESILAYIEANPLCVTQN